MSFLNLRDWAVKQRVLASDFQAHTDRLRSVTPLTFSGNVQTQGGGRNGFHVHIPMPSAVPPGSSDYLAKVTAVTGTGHTYAIKAKLYDATAAAVSGDELLIRKAMGHAVDDLIFITKPIGGTDISISGTVVEWREQYVLPNPHGARGDVVRVIDDDRKHGLDKVRYQYP
jgi:hypothetical protein